MTVSPAMTRSAGSLTVAYSFENRCKRSADFASYELANNPDQGSVLDAEGEITSNAYAFAISGNTAYIADAAANVLLSVGLDGSNLTPVAVLPKQTITNPILPTLAPGEVLPSDEPPPAQVPQQIEIESVPTSVAIGSDGALYVSEFTGFPFPVGDARIFRVEPDGETSVYADGFTQLADLEFDAQGNLYALQYAAEPEWKGDSDGSVIQIAPNGTRTTLVSGNGIESATALTVGPDGAIYISNKGDRAGVGQVLRIETPEAVPEPTSALGVLAFGVLSVTSFLKRKRK